MQKEPGVEEGSFINEKSSWNTFVPWMWLFYDFLVFRYDAVLSIPMYSNGKNAHHQDFMGNLNQEL